MDTYTLVQQVQDGNQCAQDVLYRRLRPRLMSWTANRIPFAARGLLETQDVVHEALTKCFKRLPVFENGSRHGFFAYTMRAIQNHIITLGKKKIPLQDAAVDQAFPSDKTPLDDLISREEQARIAAALEQLPMKKQDLFIARAEFQMSFPEVALHLGYPSADAARMDFKRTALKVAKIMATQEKQA